MEVAQHVILRRDFVVMVMDIRMAQHEVISDELSNSLGFEVVTPVVMKCWGISPCSPLKFNRCVRGTCLLHLQGRIISQARSQREAGSRSKIFKTLRGGKYLLS
jgi:hypothetical protein